MRGWSINLFRVRGIQLAVHVSFFVLLAFFAQDGWARAGWIGMGWSAALLVLFFVCVVLHELGHSFAAMHFGIGVRRILLMPIGGMAEFDSIPRQPSRELFITIAGPAVNFVIAGLLWFAMPETEEVLFYSVPGTITQLFYANLLMGTFNLLPAFPMDGGRILRALLAMKVPYLRATFWAASIGKVIAIAGVITSLAAPELGLADERLYFPAILFAFIFSVGELEYRLVKRRDEEDRWRAEMVRLYTSPEEPPAILR